MSPFVISKGQNVLLGLEKDQFILEAFREAQKVTTIGRSMRLGCVIYKGKTILAKGHNCANANIKIPMKYLRWKGSLHAEVAAIMNAIKKGKNLSGATLLVIRINKDNQFRIAKPCQYCELAIKELTPIRKIQYSINEFPYIKKERMNHVICK